MDAFQIIFSMALLRIVMPVGLLLLVGEWIQSRGRSRIYRR